MRPGELQRQFRIAPCSSSKFGLQMDRDREGEKVGECERKVWFMGLLMD
jgi:hypothetical protein